MQQRWLTRPFIPFPQELKTEDEANDMADLQATRIFSDGSGSFFVSKVMSITRNVVKQAMDATTELLKHKLNLLFESTMRSNLVFVFFPKIFSSQGRENSSLLPMYINLKLTRSYR